MKNIWDLGFRDKPDVLAWEKEMMGERVERIEGLATDFDMFNTWFDGLDEHLKAKDDGLVIDKSTAFQTICQTNKYQTRVGVYIDIKGIGDINHIFQIRVGGYIPCI